MFSHPYMQRKAHGRAVHRRNLTRLAELRAEPQGVPTLSLVGPCDAVPFQGRYIGRSELRMHRPWPGLKPIVGAALGGKS
jgi:hypothetical protein